jgi:hypothetical protein
MIYVARQEDASELFLFLMDLLSAPFLLMGQELHGAGDRRVLSAVCCLLSAVCCLLSAIC